MVSGANMQPAVTVESPTSSRDSRCVAASPQARELGRALGLTATVGDLLFRRGFRDDETTRRFLQPRLAHLTRPDAMADRVVAAERLATAIRGGERICVFGDYDCDGITATAILTEILRALGGDVSPLLGSRFDGGYGVSPDAVSRILGTGATVLVTCDCGSSDHAALRELANNGIQSIVVDHHLVPDEPLPSLAFLNPRRHDCGFPYKHLASCGLVLSLGAALRSALDHPLDVRAWLDLVALGTVADVVPLDGDNRVLVRAGLKVLARADRPGIKALLRTARLTPGAPITARDVAFRVAPRLNAPGRLRRPDLALDLLLARSAEQAEALAAELELLQAERREVQNRILEEAAAEIDERGWSDRPAIVIGREGWNPGVVGIVAGKLAERHECPVVVVGFDGSVGRGSVRGPRGCRLHDALGSVNGLLARFGGHQAAAGLEVARDNLEAFREAFERSCSLLGTVPSVEAREDAVDGLVPLDPDDDVCKVAEQMALLEPFGQDNPAPKLVITGDVVSARSVRGGHLKLAMDLGVRGTIRAFAPKMGDRAPEVGARLRVIGTLRPDSWLGAGAVEILVESLET